MNYKKNLFYKIGIVLIALSVAVMTISFFVMYFGSYTAIICFFAACPFFVAGFFLAQSVKRRYEEAVIYDREPVPLFAHTRYVIQLLRTVIAKRGLLKVIFISATCLFASATILLGLACGSCAYDKNGKQNNPQFIQNNEIYEEYYELWQQARKVKNEKAAHIYYLVMEQHHNANAETRNDIARLEKDLSERLAATVTLGIITIFFSLVTISYFLHKRRENRCTNTIQEKSNINE